ncbi:3-dehydroquinate synthase [Bacillota bacterium]
MYEVDVRLPAGAYKIQIEAGLLDRTGERIRALVCLKRDSRIPESRVAVISDEKVWSIHGDRMEGALKKAGFRPGIILIKPGEASKTMEGFKKICEGLADLRIRRDGLIIAFGGGVVGDMAGFAAAVYMRGLPYIQIPTTLLAQVDSSVGGKTGIDLPQGKNLLGVFHQPAAVMIDTDLLSTLEPKQLAEGMAEVIKYGAICDKDFFEEIEAYCAAETRAANLAQIVFKCCDIKRRFVEEDEKDGGERRKLNFGHSFGHAIEKIGNFIENTHGEAVAIGMCIAARVGEAMGITEAGTSERIERIAQSCGLPTELPEKFRPDIGLIIKHMAVDKKNEGQGLTLVLLKNIGESIIFRITEEELLRILRNVT